MVELELKTVEGLPGFPESSWHDGPAGRKRRCTDILFFLLLVVSWLAMTGVGLSTTGFIDSSLLEKGDPSRLMNGMDYMGNICGISAYATAIGDTISDLPMAYILPSGISVCVKECPIKSDLRQFHCKYDVANMINEQIETMKSMNSNDDKSIQSRKQASFLYYTSTKECMPHITTTPYLGYCSPNIVVENISKQLQVEYEDNNFTSYSNLTLGESETGAFFDETMADLYLVRHVILTFGIGCAVLLGFVFLFVMRIPTLLSILIWGLIFGISGCMGYGGCILMETSMRWEEEGLKEARQIQGLFWLSIISYSCGGIWFLTVICIRKRILLAIACVKEASTAISSMPMIILYPFLQVTGFVAYLLPWLVYMVYLASSGDINAGCMCPPSLDITMDSPFDLDNSTQIEGSGMNVCEDGCFQYKSFEYSQETKYAGLYLLFNLFWTSQFIIALGQLCISTAISMWYFSHDKDEVGNGTFFRAMSVATFYHCGTCAFGSLIIAIVSIIRSILMYLQKKTANLQNKTAKVVFMSLQCCLCVVEKCLKFVSKNAYIQTAIHGYSFCIGAKEAFFLILKNVLRISAVSIVSSLILFTMKGFIVTASTLLGYIYLDYYFEDQLHGLYIVTILIFLAALATAEMFEQVFCMTISTILQCFVTDEDMFEKPEDRYAAGSLADMIEKTQKASIVAKIVHPDVSGDDTDKS